MAKINNQAVMQKLIDELKLYPAKDTIPTEIAEKILAVYQINSQDVNIKGAPATYVEAVDINYDEAGASTTVFTVPATGNFYLTNATLQCAGQDNAVYKDIVLQITINEVNKKILALVISAGETNAILSPNNSLNLQNPIKLDAGSTILMIRSNTAMSGSASIVGYLEE